MYGKWHVGARHYANLPSERGFDEFFGFLAGSQDHFSNVGSFEAGSFVDLWRSSSRGGRGGGGYGSTDGSSSGSGGDKHPRHSAAYSGPAFGRNNSAYSCEAYAAESVHRIERHDTAKPLFLFLSFQQTHSPSQCPARYQDPAASHRGRKIFQGMLTCVDEATGNVTSALKRRGMWANTFFLWTSDNGGEITNPSRGGNNHPLRGGKSLDFEGGVRVVSFVAGGRLRLPPGSAVHAPIHICDWYRTFGVLAGLEPAAIDDGRAAESNLPPLDSIDQAAVLAAPTRGASTPPSEWPRREVHLSSNALIVWPLKMVVSSEWQKSLNRGLGFWTGPTWPTHLHPPSASSAGRPAAFTSASRTSDPVAAGLRHRLPSAFTPDPGCPRAVGCLFNLSDDPNERRELSADLPAEAARLRARLRKLNKASFQSGSRGDPRHDRLLEPHARCVTLEEYARRHQGFAGPVCTLMRRPLPTD
jgi:arylsulfatase B